MSNPFASGSSSGMSNMMLPMMMMAMMQPGQSTPAAPAQTPVGTPATNKPSGMNSSFVGGAAAAPTQAQTGNKTLLGQ